MTHVLRKVLPVPIPGPDGPPRNSVHRDRRHRDHVHELGEEEDREADAGVLGVEAADELLLGLDEVERRVVHLGGRRDQEDHERDERPRPVPASVKIVCQLVPYWPVSPPSRRRSRASTACPPGSARRGSRARTPPRTTAAAPTRAPSRAAGTSNPTPSPRASRRRSPTPDIARMNSAPIGQVDDLQIRLVPEDRHRRRRSARRRTTGTRAGSTGTARAGTPGRSAESGIDCSLKNSLMPSASVCSTP